MYSDWRLDLPKRAAHTHGRQMDRNASLTTLYEAHSGRIASPSEEQVVRTARGIRLLFVSELTNVYYYGLFFFF